MRVLVTGGRAPATLELVRLLGRAGHEVHVAESLWGHLAGWSRFVRANHRVAPPRQDPEGFVADLARLVESLGIDVLVPTCEEVFWVARGHAVLSGACRVLTPPLDALLPLHSKARFPDLVASLGLRAPTTRRVTSREEVAAAIASGDPIVLKPEFSRFATHAVIGPTDPGLAERLDVSPHRPWVVQERLVGPAMCSWSAAIDGTLVVHADYPVRATAGGSAIVFTPLRHPGVLEVARAVAAHTGHTGLIAFDFIEVDGVPVPIECNPRLTSGVHLFAGTPGMADALLGLGHGLVTPASDRASMLSLAMVLYGLPQAVVAGRLRAFLRSFAAARDVVFDLRDPAPTLLQAVSAAALLLRAARAGVDPLAASTLDIEYNGEP